MKMSSQNLPVFLLREVTLFPSMDIRMDIEGEGIRKLLDTAEKYFKGQILLVNQEDPLEENPSLKELCTIGILAQITMKMEMPNQKIRVTFHGIKRVAIQKFYQEEGQIFAKTQPLLTEEIDPKEEIVYLRTIKSMIAEYVQGTTDFGSRITNQIIYQNDLDTLTDIVAFSFDFTKERKLEYLLEIDPIRRAEMLIIDIRHYFQILELERQIDEKVGRKLEQEQKRFVLHEKIKAIKEELGESFDQDSEIVQFRDRLAQLDCPEAIKRRIEKEINRLEAMPSTHPEGGTIRNYIELMLSLPWSEETEDRTDFQEIAAILNKNHYGLTEMKERILEYIALRERTHANASSILCLVGPPGVGKTTLAKSIAEALNRKCAKISVGGIQDEADIVGHRKTYIGAMPGMIIQGMQKVGVINPVFIIDEIDKMAKSIHGDPASSLLEALDKEQNSHFVDHFVEEEYDLSKVLFITTANYIDQIPPELLDRLEVIELSSYTEYEKLEIIKHHILPQTIREYQLENENIRIKDDVLLTMIRAYTKEAGVREAERLIQKILRKYIKKNIMGECQTFSLTKKNLPEYLGKELYSQEKKKEKGVVGVVNGLSYTPYGGDTLKIEATMYPGRGGLTMTGSLGEVMRESTILALSYIKANARKFGVSKDVFSKNDFHVHVEEGAVRKEGPSAGVSITTALLSILTNTKIPTTVAMTGEMTLRGKVLPIGGVREKVIGAHKEKVKKIFLPAFNQRDLEEIPKEVLNQIDFVFVEEYQEIYQALFQAKKKQKKLDTCELIQLEL